MDKIIQPGKPVVGVDAGKIATLELARGPRYHAIMLECIAEAAPAVGETPGKTLGLEDFLGRIDLLIGGKTNRSHLATELDRIQTSYGERFAAKLYNYDGDKLTYANGVPQGPQAGKKTICLFTLHLAEPWRKSYSATEMMAWPTAWPDGFVLPSFQMEIGCGPSTNWKANTNMTINAFVETDSLLGSLDANKNRVMLINKFKRVSVPFAADGEMNIATLVPTAGILSQLSILMPAPATVKHLTIKQGQTVLMDATKIRNDALLIGREYNPAALTENSFDACFDRSDLPTDAHLLTGVIDFQVIPELANTDGADNLALLLQLYSQMEM